MNLFYGAAIAYTIKTKYGGDVRLIGELHGDAEEQCNLMQFVKGDVWSELETIDAMLAASQVWQTSRASKPLNVCAMEKIALNNDRIKLMNIRRREPFYLLESVLHSSQFYRMFCKGSQPTDEQLRVVKHFEKDFSHHMRTRKSTAHFLNGMLSIEEMPLWYKEFMDLFKKVGLSAHPGDFHEQLNACERREELVAFAKKHWSTMIFDNPVYSPAMQSFEGTMVIDKYSDSLRDYFVKIFSVIMDIYILALFINTKPKEITIVAGVNHISRIIDFMVHHDMIVAAESQVFADIEHGSVNLHTNAIDMSQGYPFATISMISPSTQPLFLLHLMYEFESEFYIGIELF
jgi:hypothetical protein